MADTVARTFIAEKKLTDAQIKSLFSAPFELIAAPGVGKMLMLESYYTIIDTSSGAYTSPGALDLRREGGSITFYTGDAVTEADLEAVGRRTRVRQVFTIVAASENKAMLLGQDTGDLTGGHENNYLIVRAYYRIYPIASTITGNPIQD